MVFGQIIEGVDEINCDRVVVKQEEKGCTDAETKEEEHTASDGIVEVRDGEREHKLDDGGD